MTTRMLRTLIAGAVGASLLLAVGSPARAGSIDYLTNQSADYLRSFTRNSATDGVDIISFNPAGTAWLSDGLYLSLNSQTVVKDFTITYQGEEYASTVPSPVLPSFFVAYKIKDFAAFGSFTIPAGGGSVEFERGVPFLKALALAVSETGALNETLGDAYFEGSSMYLSPTIGAAYRLFDRVSFSAACRLVFASKDYFGYANYGPIYAEIDAEKSAFGVGGIFGVHLRPIKELDIGLRFETETALEFETESTTKALKTEGNALWSFADGAKEQRDLPALLGVGLSVHFIEELSLNLSLHYYFIKAADDLEDEEGNQGFSRGYDDDYDNGYGLAVSVEGQVIDELLLSLGYSFSDLGGNTKTVSDFEMGLDSHAIATGGRIALTDELHLTLAFAAILYNEGRNETIHPLMAIIPAYKDEFPAGEQAPPEYFDKLILDFALGIEWKPL